MSGRGTPNPFGRRGQRARRRGFGIDPSFPMDESRLKGVLDNWAVEQNARFGGGLAQNVAAGRNFVAASMEADPELTTPGTGLRAQLMTSAEEAIRHGRGIAAPIPATATTPAVPAQPLHELAERWRAQPGGMGAPAPFDYQEVMQAVQPHMGSLSSIQGLHAMGLERTASTYTGVEERMRDVRGGQAAWLTSGVQSGINRVDPGLLAAAGGPAPGTIDVGTFQKAMDSPTGGPSTLRTMSIMEKMLDTLQSSLGVETSMSDTLKDRLAQAVGGAGGGRGNEPPMGAGASGLSGALFGVGAGAMRGMMGKLGEAGPEGMIAEGLFKAMDLVGVTRAREYEPIRQLELLPGQSQQGDINQIALGQTNAFGIPGRWGGAATVPFFHEMGGQSENDLRYNLQYASTAAGLGRDAGQQVAMGLGRYGVGMPGTALNPQGQTDTLMAAQVAMGPGRAAGLSLEESAQTSGLMMGQGRMKINETIQAFEELIDVSQRLGVGTKNLSESFKTMLQAGLDPRQINVRDLGVAQAYLGPGSNAGGLAAGFAQQDPMQRYASMVALGAVPQGTGKGALDQYTAMMDNPRQLVEKLAEFTHQHGGFAPGPAGFEVFQKMSQTFGLNLGAGGANMTQEQIKQLYEESKAGTVSKGMADLAVKVPGTPLEDPQKYLKDSTSQLGQAGDLFGKAVGNFVTAVNQFASTGGDWTKLFGFLGQTDRTVENLGTGGGAGPPPRYGGTMPTPGKLRPPGQHTPAPSYTAGIPDPEPLSAAQAAVPEVTSHDRPATSYVATPSLPSGGLLPTLLPSLGGDPAGAFNSPAARAALTQAILMVLQDVKTNATSPASTTSTVSTTRSDAAGGPSAGVLGGGTAFHAFTGAGPSGGVSVSSGRASQGSAMASPEVMAAYEKASAATGVPLALLLTQGAHESSLDPSTVQQGVPEGQRGYGLGQFTATMGAAGLQKYLGSSDPAVWHKAALGQGPGGVGTAALAQARYMGDLYSQSGGNWQQALDMYNAGPSARAAPGDYGSQILSAAADLDLTLSGTLTVVDQSGQKVGTAKIDRSGHHTRVNARTAAGHRTSGHAATRQPGQQGPTPS